MQKRIKVSKMFKVIIIGLLLIGCINQSQCQKKKVRSSCTCNFKLVDEPEIKLENIFPNKVRKSTCDEEASEGCKQLCIKREEKNINGDLNAIYPTTDLKHGDIVCNWLKNDVEKDVDGELTIESILECNNKKFEKETGLQFAQRLTCENGEFKAS